MRRRMTTTTTILKLFCPCTHLTSHLH